MSDTDRLLKEALELPKAQRAALAGTLIESLDTDVDSDAEAVWAVEIARRVASSMKAQSVLSHGQKHASESSVTRPPEVDSTRRQ